jgi:oligosaccharide repeat unit polymerase
MTVLILVALSFLSYLLNRRLMTTTIAFCSFWIVGFTLKYIYFFDYEFENPIQIYILVACALSISSEILVKSIIGPTIRKKNFTVNRIIIKRVYITLLIFCLLGSVLKLYTVYNYFGDWRILISGDLILRDAVISRDLVFSGFATTLLSFGYIAAAVCGYLIVKNKIKLFYFLHLIPFFFDSVAIAGRGSFLIAMIITLFSVFLVISVKFNTFRLLTISLVFILLLFAVSRISGRNIESNLVQYLTVPLFGFDNFLTHKYNSKTLLPSTFNAILSRAGFDLYYEPDDAVFLTPFRSNVFSGFRETLFDFQEFGLFFLFVIFLFAQVNVKLFLRDWNFHNFLYAVCFLTFITYYYFVSLSAFLPAWWIILFSGIVMNFRAIIQSSTSSKERSS